MKVYNPVRTLVLAACLVVVLCARAQTVEQFTYSHLGLVEGLCSQRIYSICQTGDGALWWTTKKDVERYNGIALRHYQLLSGETYSDFAGRTIKLHLGCQDSALYAFDHQGRIFAYDEVLDRFRLRADVGEMLETAVVLNDICVSAHGIWLAMREGVYFLHDKVLTPVVRGTFTNAIVATKYGVLLCTKDGVMGWRDDGSGQPEADMQLPTLLTSHVESGYYDAKYDVVWLGSFVHGLRILEHTADGLLNTSQPHNLSTSQPLSDICNPVRSICPYDDTTMLVGIDGQGVFKVSRQPTEAGLYEGQLLFDANEGDEGVLHGNGVYAVVHDSWGNIVVGSYSGGIDIARPVCSTLAVFQHVRGNRQSLLNDRVNCVAEFPDGTLVMGTDNGISLYNHTRRRWTHCCEGAVVLSLCPTPEGNMLASTYGSGVWEITEGGVARQLYTKSGGVLRDDHVYRMMYDRDGDLWMGCLDGDLVSRTAAGWCYYPIRNVQDIVQLPDGTVAVATVDGIKLISKSEGQLGELDYSSVSDNVNRYVLALFVNDGRQLWIGTDGGGAYVYDLRDRSCIQLTVADGLPSNVVCSFAKDGMGRIHIATEEGLAFVNPTTDSKGQRPQVFCMNYGYGIEREYSARAAANLLPGHLFFGTTTGALILNPANIQELNYEARLRLVGVGCAEAEGDRFARRVHEMLARRELRLDYAQRTFDLYIESVNLRNQFDIVYQYKMAGGEWSQPSNQQTLRFTNMASGSHELILRCVSRTCGTVLDELTLNVVVAQPWWNSWWMWVLYVCLILLAFYGAWRVYQLHEKYMRLVVSDLNTPASAVPSGRQPDSPGAQPSASPAPQTPASQATTPAAVVSTRAEGEGSDSRDSRDHTDDGSEFIARVTKLVADNLADTEFNIDRLCREMAMSRTLFYLKLKTYTGKSPQDFIRIIRLERAAALLRSGRGVTDTALQTGFDNAKYFSTVFKKYFGVSPSKYC